MKKFVFSLQKILEYKEHIQQNEQNTLRILQQDYVRLCAQLEQMVSHYEQLKSILKKKVETGISVQELINIERFITELQQQMRDLKRKIEIAAQRMETQRQKLVEATKEKVSLEKLREKHYETYQVLERKESEILISEFINNSVASA